jgi:hypothetical protein
MHPLWKQDKSESRVQRGREPKQERCRLLNWEIKFSLRPKSVSKSQLLLKPVQDSSCSFGSCNHRRESTWQAGEGIPPIGPTSRSDRKERGLVWGHKTLEALGTERPALLPPLKRDVQGSDCFFPWGQLQVLPASSIKLTLS